MGGKVEVVLEVVVEVLLVELVVSTRLVEVLVVETIVPDSDEQLVTSRTRDNPSTNARDPLISSILLDLPRIRRIDVREGMIERHCLIYL